MNTVTFAKRLKLAMIESNLNQLELSKKIGASKAAVSQYLSGKNAPSPERIAAMANATGTTMEYLLGQTELQIEPIEMPTKRITTKAAARCIGKSEQFIRIGLQRGLLPFGNAVPGAGKHWNYYISPYKFRDYVGAERFNEFFNITENQQ